MNFKEVKGYSIRAANNSYIPASGIGDFKLEVPIFSMFFPCICSIFFPLRTYNRAITYTIIVQVTVSGYAISGGGRGIERVDVSFDGGKTRRPRGIYTVTITTPGRQSFLYDLHDASKVSHTAEYLLEILEEVCSVTSQRAEH